jgi:hypothetical protein
VQACIRRPFARSGVPCVGSLCLASSTESSVHETNERAAAFCFDQWAEGGMRRGEAALAD